MTTTALDFQIALDTFLATTQARLDAEYAQNYGDYPLAPAITGEKGRKYVKIVSSDKGGGGRSRSVFCFIRIADGAVLKAEGWQKPAKHARGSIYTNAGQDAIGTYGARYLR